MKRTILPLSALFAFSLLGFTSPALAQKSIDSFGTQVQETFDDFRGTGFSTSPGSQQLSSNEFAVSGLSDGDLNFGGAGTSGDFARGTSTGGTGTGGIYAFETSSGDYALGFQAGGSDLTPGAIFVCYRNDTGSAITSLEVEYDVKEFNDKDRSNSIELHYQAGSSCESTAAGDVTVDFASASLSFTSSEAAAGSPSWATQQQPTTITGLNVADGDRVTLALFTNDVRGSGARDELAIDNLGVTAQATSGPVTNTNTGESFSTIQAAIDDADTDAGHVIEVSVGTYTETVTINKGVTLNGPNAGTPGADSRSAEAMVEGQMIVTATGATVDGFEVVPPPATSNATAEAIRVSGGADDVVVAKTSYETSPPRTISMRILRL